MEPNFSPENSRSKSVYVLLVAIVALIGGLFYWNYSQEKDLDTNNNNNGSQATNTPAIVDNRKYKNGTYSADGNYVSPGGNEEINITLVIMDDKVTDAIFVSKAVNEISKKMQQAFSEGFKTVVVGKSIDEISLTVVNGSSLTPKGFMDALSKIKTEAQVTA